MVVDGGRRRPELDYDSASGGDAAIELRASVGDADCGQRSTAVEGVRFSLKLGEVSHVQCPEDGLFAGQNAVLAAHSTRTLSHSQRKAVPGTHTRGTVSRALRYPNPDLSPKVTL